MKEVLLLGNGISRQEPINKNFIDNWNKEVWGCNRVFKEYKNLPRLDILMGDYAAILEAIEYKKEFGATYTIYGKKNKPLIVDLHKAGEPLNLIEEVPIKYQKDTGTTLVRMALNRGYDKIYLCGFDLGGPDIYMANHELRNKSNWIENWRQIDKEYGLDKIEFIGKDHKKLIQSDLPIDSYANLYMNNKNHLEDTVLIVGNGTSRQNKKHKEFIKNWKGEIWGCNDAYKENVAWTRAGSLHHWKALEIYEYVKKAEKKFRIFSTEKRERIEQFHYASNGGNTGYLWILQAYYEGFQKIILIGFDFGGPDIYTNAKNGQAFQNRFRQIINEIGLEKIQFYDGMPEFLE